MPPPTRMTANPVKPSRYRAGKATRPDSESDSDASENDEVPSKPVVPPPPKAASAGKIISNLGKVDLNARRKDAADAEARRLAAQKAEQLAAQEGFVTEEEEESEEEDDDDEEDEDDSEEEESSEEEEAPRRLMMRPKFVPKNQRGNKTTAEDDEEARRQAEEEARKKAADELVEEQIKKDLAARAAGKKHWDDEENEDSDVDTTDGLDPEAEEAAWRVRELKRLKRARAAIEEREAELAEVERRRNLTEEERKAEDEAYLAQQKEDKESKGKMSYMQKYFHKGAFFQEEAEAAGLLQRDLMGTRIQDDVRNREALPEYLQRRDMTKLGRKGATKYRDMRSEDTGRWGSFDDGRRDRSGRYDSDDRFRPDDDRFKPDERGAKGANAIPLGDRRDRRGDEGRGADRYRSDDKRDERDDGHRSRRDDEDRRGSRSRSPRRDHDDYRSRRKRSTSRDGDRYDSDKRRRVDTR
ncbi:micro-fibrillar-associated [Paramyrothecium foliicola]|nr:micro-fibrillar-associated [Paramyrothecium foliicola]